MRFLFIGVNRSYTNPTAETLIGVFSSFGAIDFYGPGYVSENCLKKGINLFIDQNDNYDVLITDSYIFEQENIVKRIKPFIGDHIRFYKEDFFKYAPQLQEYFIKSTSHTKILLANFDTYSISEKILERIIKANTYIIDGGFSLNRDIREVEEIYGERPIGNNNWFDFVNTEKSKIISIPHTIAYSEIDFTPLIPRKFIFNVVGAPYKERRDAYKLLTSSQKFDKLFNRIGNAFFYRLNQTLSSKQLEMLQRSYLENISQSIFCYCSGGPWLSPVRKYFEIPSRGSLAIGWPCNGFDNLGFKDKTNFFVAKSNTEISQIIDNYNLEELQVIASAGRKLILENHSAFARITQLKSSLQLISKGLYKGSYWRNGEYINI